MFQEPRSVSVIWRNQNQISLHLKVSNVSAKQVSTVLTNFTKVMDPGSLGLVRLNPVGVIPPLVPENDEMVLC